MRNEGIVYKTAKERELTRDDFCGLCVIAEIGASLPVVGIAGTAYLFNINPAAFAMAVASPTLAVVERALGYLPPFTPKAVVLSDGDTRGFGIGATAYVGYVW